MEPGKNVEIVLYTIRQSGNIVVTLNRNRTGHPSLFEVSCWPQAYPQLTMQKRKQPLNQFSAMKLLIGVSGVTVLLASCCCPELTGGRDSVRPVPPPLGGGTEAGSQVVVIRFQNPLPVTPRDQEGLYSCWAASAEMIMEFIGGVRVRQCVQADRPFYRSICCDQNWDLTVDPDCDSPNFPEFGRWGYDYQYHFQQALAWNAVMAEIDGGRPFAFSWTRTDSTGTSLPISHMMVVIGYEEGNGQRTLVCLNPKPFAHTGHTWIPFADYVGSPASTGATATAPGSSYLHELDYFQIKPSP